ncbi:MAG: patatin-like phospholipase family protein [Flavobacteriales bacterium]|nr:patatin-like phospholipase family protein [Flavobacteriales bacterium]
MGARTTYRYLLRRVMYFFPIQLLLLHLKKNHLLLLTWLLLFGYITENIGVKYGIPYLFLYPEYYGDVGFYSYAITGFALGGFITAFNLYSYAMHGYRFPFIATIARPFLKFNINNAVIPAIFVLSFLVCSGRFQYANELVPMGQVIWHLLGFVFGILLFLALALLYFTRTNTDIIKMLGREPDEYRPAEPLVDIIGPQYSSPPQRRMEQRKASRWLQRQQRSEKWRVDTYLTPRFHIKLARSSSHYDKELLRDVLWQNHINGSIFEVVLVVSFIALGAFSDFRFFAIPAGASVFLLMTMFLMIISALFSWMQGWTGTVILVAVVALNLLSQRTDSFLYDNHAYGLDYDVEPAAYDRADITTMANDKATAQRDADAIRVTLDRWRQDNVPFASNTKPPLVIVNTSGGGIRSMLWTMLCLQYADSLVGGSLMDRTALVTGSSGGLIGAAYYRQLYLAEQRGSSVDRFDKVLLDEISSDMLNALTFSFVTNDMFVRYRTVEDGDKSYTLDRGYAFERRLNQNTRGMLDVRLSDLAAAERDAKIPLMVISPASINDGRRLVVAALPMAFLTYIEPEASIISKGEAEAIEFQRMFHDQGASNLKLTSALRMNATFPYITPIVTLPSEPKMRVMDAGLRDNYGYRVSIAFLTTFREWIKENTSGVVVLQLRDTQKELEVKPSSASLIGRVLDPVGSVYDNVVRVQDQDYDLLLQQVSTWADFPVEMIDIQLRHGDEEQISLSWHLTALERKRVLRSIRSEENQRAFDRFKNVVLGNGTPMTLAVGDTAQDPTMDPLPRP